MTGCRLVVSRLDAYADGELVPDQVIEIEGHLAECNGCSARLQLEHATRKSMRRTVYAAAVPTDAFRERLALQLRAAEAAEEQASAAGDGRRGAMLSWGSILPLAAAAAIALFWSKDVNDHRVISPKPSNNAIAASDPINVEQLLDEIIDRHVDRSKPTVTEATLLDGMEPEVGVPVHAPSLAQYGARWEGGSVVPIRDQRAASLRYRLDGHRMTLYVFNSERFPLNTRLKKRVVRDEPVYVGWKRGFSIAAKERRGVGYAVATDLGEDEGAEIVASLH